MKWPVTALACAVFSMSGCGSDSQEAPTPPPASEQPPPNTGQPPPANGGQTGNVGDLTPTAVGAPLGAAVSKQIGTEGGELATADGALIVIVPAGAFAVAQTVSIQEITRFAHGAKGRAFRIQPEGLHTTAPMTLRFRVSDDDLAGTTLDLLTIGWQDDTGRWHAYAAPQIDTAARTLSVPTRHFSDWSMIAGAQITPARAIVRTGENLPLQVISCRKTGLPPDGELEIPTIGYDDCEPSPIASFSTRNWAVNGAPGGGGSIGTVVADADRWSGKATFHAPTTKPQPNVVAVSAEHRFDDGNGPHQLLVANVTLVDANATCDGMGAVKLFDVDVSLDDFSYLATAEHRRHEGHHAGRLVGKLTKITQGNLPFDVWMSTEEPLRDGFVKMHDSYIYEPPSGDGYSGTVVADGIPHDAPNAPSFVSLKLDYSTCTFDLFASFTIVGTLTHDGESVEQPIGMGGLYLYGQAIPPEQLGTDTLDGRAKVQVSTDTEITGYVPFQEAAVEWQMSGETWARWRIAPRD
ncbi:MAG TPA: hypothetical protein PKE27_18435 [Povalibacter sp.]|uniref:hypothetical protein n=1 Tax=Povalibacter sp. TaxID=1962978 RepID=UPI002C369827|nr:hypothetical protein [Povalibacter sp.]HMN46561.1 hypothetical protein [Povalibacter sp.]